MSSAAHLQNGTQSPNCAAVSPIVTVHRINPAAIMAASPALPEIIARPHVTPGAECQNVPGPATAPGQLA